MTSVYWSVSKASLPGWEDRGIIWVISFPASLCPSVRPESSESQGEEHPSRFGVGPQCPPFPLRNSTASASRKVPLAGSWQPSAGSKERKRDACLRQRAPGSSLVICPSDLQRGCSYSIFTPAMSHLWQIPQCLPVLLPFCPARRPVEHSLRRRLPSTSGMLKPWDVQVSFPGDRLQPRVVVGQPDHQRAPCGHFSLSLSSSLASLLSLDRTKRQVHRIN